jgi:Spy/CpxP family protein refolding chaperone
MVALHNRCTIAPTPMPPFVHGLNVKEDVMNSSLKLSLIAGLLIAAGVAYSQATTDDDAPWLGGMTMGQPCGAQGMGNRGKGKMDPAKMQAMRDQRHAALKAQLKLTPAQEAAWTTFSTQAVPVDKMMTARPDPAEMAKLTTPERLDKMKTFHAEHIAQMTAAMEKHADAVKTFYAVLTPEQQKVFDTHTMQGRGMNRGTRAGMGMQQPRQ